MDGESEVGSDNNGLNIEEELKNPSLMTDELFEHLTTKTATVKFLFDFICLIEVCFTNIHNFIR